MPLTSFATWLQSKHRMPEADRVVPLIVQAGPEGLSRGQIASAIDLERDTLDELLGGLVRFGTLVVTSQDGVLVYRAA